MAYLIKDSPAVGLNTTHSPPFKSQFFISKEKLNKNKNKEISLCTICAKNIKGVEDYIINSFSRHVHETTMRLKLKKVK